MAMGTYRCDVGTLKRARYRADGSIVVEAHITRAGVFTYSNPDGSTRREYRPPAEVFSAESLESFAMVPVTDEHPPTMISAKNARKFQVGSVGENVRQDGDHVIATVAVTDDALVAKMKAGKREVSCGYSCDLDETPGTTPDGVRYDAVQRNIRGNHLAVVTHGRAGSARVRMDGASIQIEDDMSTARTDAFPPKKKPAAAPAPAAAPGAVPPPAAVKAPPAEEPPAEEAVEGEQPAEGEQPEQAAPPQGIPPAGAPAPGAAPAAGGGSVEARLAAALGQIASLIQELTEAKAAGAGAMARADEAVAALKQRNDAIDTIVADRVRARAALVTTAAPVLGADRLDALDDRGIRLAFVKEVTGVTFGDDRSDDYVLARYDAAVERYAASRKAGDKLADVLALRRDDFTTDTAEAARARMIAERGKRD